MHGGGMEGGGDGLCCGWLWSPGGRLPGRSAAAATAAEEVTQFCRNVRIPGMWWPGPHSAAAVE